MASRGTTFTARMIAAALLAATLSTADVPTASAQAESVTTNTAQMIANGGGHTCALLDNNTVKCWGYNGYGALGLGDSVNRGDNPGEMGNNLAPVDLGPGRTATAITAGEDYTCALLDDGTVKCWGANHSGQLGQGDTADRGLTAGQMGDNLPPVDLGPGRTAAAITAGEYHTCALLDNNTVKCWGYNPLGQLGQGDTANRGDNPGEMGANLATVDLGPLRTATAITAGTYYTCALLDNNTIKCWGENVPGQLGQGDIAARGDNPGEMGDNLPPVDLGPGRTATAVTAGGNHTCALLDNNTIKCWGFNVYGGLGQGDNAARGDNPGEMGDNLPPVDLGPGRTATAITAGDYHTCALLDNNTIKCWGYNNSGQLGQGDTAHRGDNANEMGANLAPVDLGPGRTATAITASDFQTCALLDNNTVKCWGRNGSGQLGQGDTTNRGDNANEMGANLAPIDLGTTPKVTAGGVLVSPEGDTGSTVWNLPVTLSAPSSLPVTVDWTTLDVASNPTIAHPGSDYVAASGTVTFAPGQTTKNIPIEILGDIVDEPPALYGEWGLVALSNPTNATIDTGGLYGLGLFIIVDDDPPPKVKAGTILVDPEGDTGSTVWNLPVRLSAPSAATVTVNWTTLDVPSDPAVAHPGSDYVAASGTLAFGPGQTTKNVAISVLGDTLDEPPLLFGEWGFVSLSNPVNATIDTSSFFGLGLFAIVDDD